MTPDQLATKADIADLRRDLADLQRTLAGATITPAPEWITVAAEVEKRIGEMIDRLNPT